MKIDGKKILIVGLGMIGGSYADGLSAAGHEIGAIDSDPAAIGYALDKGLIRRGRTSADPGYISQFDIIVFALYPQTFIDWVRTNGSCIKKGAIVTDVTGVKSGVVPAISELLPAGVDWVPAHPMAGREVYGVQNCSRSIFSGANFIITPCERTSAEGVETVREMAALLGFSRISELSPEEHDEMIGFLSQLTHCIAVALMTSNDNPRLVDYTGDSFRDLTRIARINENMWTELFLDNRRQLLAQMDRFVEELGRLRRALDEQDAETIKSMMRLSTARRKEFDK